MTEKLIALKEGVKETEVNFVAETIYNCVKDNLGNQLAYTKKMYKLIISLIKDSHEQLHVSLGLALGQIYLKEGSH